jgi:hypothetical protein
MRSVSASAVVMRRKSVKGKLEQAVWKALAESDLLRRERERLAKELVRLNTEVVRLTGENDDLRASAELWIWLYESQLARANAAIRELKTRIDV